MTNKEIGEKIRVMRESRGMTQKDLSIAIRKSESAIAMYESGKRRPKEPVAEALADTFNIPKWAIYYREDEMIPANDDSSPRTIEARAVSGWMDDLPEAQRKFIENLVAAAIKNFPDKE